MKVKPQKLVAAAALTVGLVLAPSVALAGTDVVHSGPSYGDVYNGNLQGGYQWVKIPASPWDNPAKHQSSVECIEYQNWASYAGGGMITCNWPQYDKQVTAP